MSGKGSHTNPGSMNVVVLLPGEHIDRLDALARHTGRTRSALVREAVAAFLERGVG